MSDAFWAFSLRFYDEPAVQAACLDLQDRHGADVNVALYLLWRASRGDWLDAAGVGVVDAHVAAWRRTVVAPLRAIRRELKARPLLPDDEAQQAFRNKVKKIELDSEKLEQTALEEGRFPAVGQAPPAEAAARSLEGYAVHLAASFAPDTVDALLARFAAVTTNTPETP